MTILVAGATGSTGRLLVEQLLSSDQKVRAIARSRRSLPDEILDHPNATVIEASLLNWTDEEMMKHVDGCDAETSPYDIHPSPTTGILSGRPTTRANVAHFMTQLIADAELWDTRKFRMPVIMNREQ